MTDDRTPDPQSPADRASGAESSDAWDRLRAADPAAEATPDLTALRGAVDRRIAAESASPAGVAPSRPTAMRPAAPRWQRLAAVAAAVAVVGGGAFVVGQQTAGGQNVPVAAVAESGGISTPAGAPSTAQSPSSTVEQPSAGGAESQMAAQPPTAGAASLAAGQDSKMIGYGGRTHFVDGGLPTDAGTGTAWTYQPGDAASAATAERVAAALGISGTAVAEFGAFTVGPNDGTAPSVSIVQDGTASFTYTDPTVGGDCSVAAEPVPDIAPDATAGSTPSADVPSTGVCPAAIGAQDAVDRSAALLTTVGLDPAAFTLTSPDDQVSGGYRSVSGSPLVDGVDLGYAWSFSFVGDRIAFFSGPLAPLAGLGDYELISPAQAVARMNDTRFGAVNQFPMPMATTDAARNAEPGAATSPSPVPPTPGAPLPWPTTEITLTAATPALTTQYLDDGVVLALPAWSMTDSSGASWTVLAVADAGLDLAG